MNISIRLKLVLIAAIMLVSVIIIVALEYVGNHQIADLRNSYNQLQSLDSNMLLLRRNEKDFMARSDLKYQAKFIKNADRMKSNMQWLDKSFLQQGIQTDKLASLCNGGN